MTLLGLLLLQAHHVARTLPYPQAADEIALSAPAAHILTAGSLHPTSFNYPSLPEYIVAAAMAVGVVRASTQLEMRELEDLGNVGYPYYDQRRPIETARDSFLLLAAIALAMTGAAAWFASGRSAAILLAPLLAAATPLFFFQSWAYLNVDIVGTCFVAMTLAASLRASYDPSVRRSALAPGILAGLAAGSKYTLAIAILPVLLGIWLYLEAGARRRATIIAVTAALLTFLACVPYALLDIPGFLNGLMFEGYHYANGHPGAEGTPGLAQLLFYLGQFVQDFGAGGCALALIGLAAYSYTNPGRSAMLLSFPVVSLLVLEGQRARFPRNVVSLYPEIAIYAAMGFLIVHGWALWALRRRNRPTGFAIQAAIAVPLVLLAVPLEHVRDAFRDHTDSRVAAVKWLEKAIAPSWTIVVPKELAIDLRPLEGARHHPLGPYGAINPALEVSKAAAHKVKVVELASGRTAEGAETLVADVEMPSVILVPAWGVDPWWPGNRWAGELNKVAERWPVVKRFGAQPVIVNHEHAAPWGNPAFGVAPLKLPAEWTTWLAEFDARYQR